MKKSITLFLSVLLYGAVFSQVGIGTTTPKASLDVSEMADKTSANEPQGLMIPKLTGDQIKTMTLTADHNSLMVYATSAATSAVGTQAEMIDSEGYYYYESVTSKFVKVGAKSAEDLKASVASLTGASNLLEVNGASYYTGTSVTLPPGKWLLDINMLIRLVEANGDGIEPKDNESHWIRTSFSESNTSFSPTPDFLGSTKCSGAINGPTNYGLVMGKLIINNTSGSDKTYYFWRIDCESFNVGGWFDKTRYLSNFGTSLWSENQIIIQPVN